MIILVRHGERADNCPFEKNLITNIHDPHLTQKGQSQALKAGESLKNLINDYNEVHISSSPFLRCMMTTQQICQQIGKNSFKLKTEICETLYPHFFSEDPLPLLEYNSNKSLNKQIVKIHDEFEVIDEQSHHLDSYYPESIDDVKKRIVAEVQKNLEDLEDSQCRILVTHQRALKSIIELFDNQESTMDIGYCKIVALKKKNSKQIQDCQLLLI